MKAFFLFWGASNQPFLRAFIYIYSCPFSSLLLPLYNFSSLPILSTNVLYFPHRVLPAMQAGGDSSGLFEGQGCQALPTIRTGPHHLSLWRPSQAGSIAPAENGGNNKKSNEIQFGIPPTPVSLLVFPKP